MKKSIIIQVALLCLMSNGYAQVLVEAEYFQNKGGWVTDQQFHDQMGSSFLMAHGLGKPVQDASTIVSFPRGGTYSVYVRTRNWAGYWTRKDSPGKFRLTVNGVVLPAIFGTEDTEWSWQYGGTASIEQGQNQLVLHDLTGFNGRCDAIVFSPDSSFRPPDNSVDLAAFRKTCRGKAAIPVEAGTFDLVVVGGGIAGICTAISASRLGLKVALIHDRPVLGGNNSSEIRVHLGGRINLYPYPNLGNLVNEIGPSKGGNARDASFYEDSKKLDAVKNEKNISLFLNYRVTGLTKTGSLIKSVIAAHTGDPKEYIFRSPLFADCTGDGNIGAMAGADYMIGREAQSDFNERTAPKKRDNLTMGSSVQWYSEESDQPVDFPDISWGAGFDESSSQAVKMGEWTWETGMQYNPITDFERIRDYGLLVVFSNWSYLKNHSSKSEEFRNSYLSWVAYIAGKRESRRLIGDYILKEQDIINGVVYSDGTASASWSIDLHYPDPKNSTYFPGAEFLSIATQVPIYPYPIPYRCLYSRNIANLFMAGRDISVTHIALGTTRVMRTTGMMGEVVGMAASVCKKYRILPRDVYQKYFNDLKILMVKGTGKTGIPSTQNYNLGKTLSDLVK